MRLKRMHPPGTSPGTVTVPVEVEVPARAVLTRYSPGAVEEVEIDARAALPDARRPGESWWLDVVGLNAELIGEIGARFDIPSLVLEDVVNVGQRPKVEEYETCVFVVADLVRRPDDDDRLTGEQISLVVLPDALVSFRERPGGIFDPIRRRLAGGKGRIRSGGIHYLLYALLDVIVDTYLPVLDSLGSTIEKIEEDMVEDGRPDPVVLAQLHGLRRDLVLIRRSAWPEREVLARLLRAEDELVDEDTRVFLRDVSDHLALIADTVEFYQEIVTSLLELHMSSVSNRMSEVMKVLTMIATIFMPLSFIAGVYGMNFDRSASPYNMPELGWAWGYPAALLLMAAVAGVLLLFFRRRGWI